MDRRGSTAVARLTAAGAITVGKLNMTELALAPFGENAHHGDCPESVEIRSCFGRLEQRLRRRSRRTARRGRSRDRHRRVDSTAGRVLRYRRPETHLRSREPCRRDAALVVARSRGTDGADGPRRRGHARRDRRA
ncbi:MAG: hypothetical protein DMD83_19780 [Candidatus Rokuibacteriota bacterium]|nr:MAG: hypothetical protein DMD83_19780 [Candidatus Rokubacteria bacterium]